MTKSIWGILKRYWWHHIGKAHIQPTTKKQPDNRRQGNQPALYYCSKSLIQNAAQKKETTAKAEVKEAQVRQGFDHEVRKYTHTLSALAFPSVVPALIILSTQQQALCKRWQGGKRDTHGRMFRNPAQEESGPLLSKKGNRGLGVGVTQVSMSHLWTWARGSDTKTQWAFPELWMNKRGDDIIF